LQLAYVPPETDTSTVPTKAPKSLHPQIGDLVRYYDLDGGNQRGQELVGKITFLSKVSDGFLAEITELEDVGDGYYAEYSSQKRMSKKTDRNLLYASPLMASFVRSEQAFKVPVTAEGGVRVRQETYDLADYKGPVFSVNTEVVEQDGVNYDTLKFNLLKDAALTGLGGSVVVNLLKGPEIAAIYFAGALASIGYLFFLSIKTDTLASPDAKLGKNVANLRFLLPVFVILGVAFYNQAQGDANPLKDSGNPFDTVTTEQFGAAVLGFLTYRLPLFIGQVRDAFKEEEDIAQILPGSAGVAMQLAKNSAAVEASINEPSLIPVLLVSGPKSTGRSELVSRLLANNDRLVLPKLIDRVSDGVTFERLEERGEVLELDPTGRFGLTKDSILQAAEQASLSSNNGEDENLPSERVVVVDADVNLAKQLQNTLRGARLIGVWVGLDTVQEFEDRIQADIENGIIKIPPEETAESTLRQKIREIVGEIEYGLGSGIFEFTVLNTSQEKSLKELQEAAEYCFK
jgi:hypothetical protein